MKNNAKANAAQPVFAPRTERFNLDTLLGGSTDKGHLDADWNAVEPSTIHAIVWAVTAMGGTVQFGTTKNCKAYTVKIYISRPYDPVYFDGNEEGRAAFAALASALVEAVAGAS